MTLQDDDFLGAADRIGTRLARDALWQGERCNWTGDSMEWLEGRWQVAHRALGCELYAGSSGVALFMARLASATGERLHGQVALGAMEHALSRVASLPEGARSGLHAGALGVAWAAVRVGLELDMARLVERGARLATEVGAAPREAEGLDVTAGSAGAVGALLDLAEALSFDPALQARLRAAALEHAERLVATARPGERGLSWPAPGASRGLCGLSHGAAGFAWALLCAHRASGREAFHEAADAALRYERSWFDAREQNWPDLRDGEGTAGGLGLGDAADRRIYMSTWCHGAPGIALARVACLALGGDARCRDEAFAAARTTATATRLGAASAGSWSLCHGVAGNADVLLEAARGLGESSWRDVALEAGRAGIARYARHAAPWPCGVPGGGETPSLMLGLAGIGHFYLRLHDPRLPTVLLVPMGAVARIDRGPTIS
jgi:lantibiotic modifying enzyme